MLSGPPPNIKPDTLTSSAARATSDRREDKKKFRYALHDA